MECQRETNRAVAETIELRQIVKGTSTGPDMTTESVTRSGAAGARGVIATETTDMIGRQMLERAEMTGMVPAEIA